MTVLAEAPLQTSANRMLQLHRLMAAGLDDAEHGDALRDQMDDPWLAMNGRERELIQGLSEDLYVLAEGSKSVPASPAERAAWERQAGQAFKAGDYDGLLTLLRRPPADIPAAQIHGVQGWCWDRLGVPEVALEFMQAAERLDPVYAAAVASILYRLGRADEAAESTNRFVETQAHALFPAVAAS
jgi:tetratricopeptide (TPR) repeat protein